MKDLEKHDVDFVIAYASAYAGGVGGLPGIESLLVGRDTLIPVCKARGDGAPLFDLAAASRIQVPYLRFGATAPISRHIEPLLAGHGLDRRLAVVYENSMAGALRIRARDGAGVAWLPRILVAPDLESGLLTVTGDPAWEIRLEIRLHRLRGHTNRLTCEIWGFLSVREAVPLFSEI